MVINALKKIGELEQFMVLALDVCAVPGKKPRPLPVTAIQQTSVSITDTRLLGSGHDLRVCEQEGRTVRCRSRYHSPAD